MNNITPILVLKLEKKKKSTIMNGFHECIEEKSFS